MGIETIGYALVSTTNILLLVQLLRRGFMTGDAGRAEWLFVSAIVLSAAWGISALAGDAWRSPAWDRVAAAADILRYGSWMAFLLVVLYPESVKGWARRPVAVAAFAVVAFSLVGLAVSSLGSRGLGQALAGGSLALAVTGLVLLEQVWRNQPAESTWNIKPICIGLAFGFAYDIYVFSEAVMFGRLDQDAVDVRAIVHSLATPLLFVASQRHRSWAQRLQLSRNAVFYSATLLLIGVYLLFIAGVGYYVRYFGGTWGRALQVAVLAAALLAMTVVLLSTSLRARLRVFLGKHLFSYRFDYREEWLRFTAMLSTPTAPTEVGGLVIRGLADMVECPAGGLWTRQLGGVDYVPAASWNMNLGEAKESPDSSLCRLLCDREWIIDIEEFRSQPRLYGDLVLPLWLATHPNAWLVIPLLVGGKMIGFVVLAKPRTAVDLNWEVRDLLKTAARQAAVFLAQMHATEALLEARKFDAFNRMSAFVVHDLKNIITQLSLMLKNAQRHAANPEFQQDMLLTVESSLDKMRQMMAQLREGQKPVGSVSGVDLAALLERLRSTAEARGRNVDLELVDPVSTRGHPERLERVLGHVVQNALDATTASGRVWIRLERDAGRARIVVADTGVGMTKEFIHSQLFRPFNTTKESGMGIGSYESYQYISELGGSMKVESEVGQGTEITILLPLLDTRTRSDLTSPGSLAA
jgi:putative PEP-CTERM system histidine kinase